MATSRRPRPGLVKGRDGKTRWSADVLRDQLAKYTTRLVEERDQAARFAAADRAGGPSFQNTCANYEGQMTAYAHALSLLSIMTLEEFGDDPGAEQRAAKLKELAANRADAGGEA
ncbi:hypothetical protein [Amycolatopsis sp. cmx-4-68]|uniref:hypothetical protein n=1 Tax=Amycolatopsis sp. cmx-4-68 TaxID=2790938 RepID=UPI00397E06CE